MALLCKIAGHERPTGKPIWNDGHFFGTCARCGADIVRSGTETRWADVPRGFRVSWRERTEFDIRW